MTRLKHVKWSFYNKDSKVRSDWIRESNIIESLKEASKPPRLGIDTIVDSIKRGLSEKDFNKLTQLLNEQ